MVYDMLLGKVLLIFLCSIRFQIVCHLQIRKNTCTTLQRYDTLRHVVVLYFLLIIVSIVPSSPFLAVDVHVACRGEIWYAPTRRGLLAAIRKSPQREGCPSYRREPDAVSLEMFVGEKEVRPRVMVVLVTP